MSVLLGFIQGHGLGAVMVVFTIASIVLSAVAAIFVALGKQAPGIIGTALDMIGKVLHLLNGNLAAAKPAPVEAPKDGV